MPETQVRELLGLRGGGFYSDARLEDPVPPNRLDCSPSVLNFGDRVSIPNKASDCAERRHWLLALEIGVTPWSMLIGGMGGVLYWATPPSFDPQEFGAVAKRIGVAVVVGFLANVVAGISPFDSAGNWNPTSVVGLVAIGFGGLSSLVQVLPENPRAQLEQKSPSKGDNTEQQAGTPKSSGKKGAADQKQAKPKAGGGLLIERKGRAGVEASASQLRIAFETEEDDDGYFVGMTPHWATTFDVTDKDKGGFTVEFGTNPDKDSELEYMIAR